MWRPIDMTTFGSNIPKLEFPTTGNDTEHRGRAKVKTNSAYLKHSDRTWITLTEKYIASYYHPPTKLWEGNVFSHACLSRRVPMWPLHMMQLTSPYRDHSLALTPSLKTPSGHGTSLYSPVVSGIWWPRLKTCLNFLMWAPPRVVTSGGYWYCWQAGGTYSTGMVSCMTHVMSWMVMVEAPGTLVPRAYHIKLLTTWCGLGWIVFYFIKPASLMYYCDPSHCID